jgi:hypothetical protein
MYLKPTLGGDPEFFIYLDKKSGKMQIISADKLLPPKATPGEINQGIGDSLYSLGKYHFDGVQAEINPRENQCRESIIGNIHTCLRTIYTLSSDTLKTSDLLFAPLASIKITPKDIEGADMECKRFGCSPDANIYDEPKIEYPDGNVFMTRFSGGHIHIGFDQIMFAEKMKIKGKLLSLIKALDYIPGLLSVAISPGKEEVVRRQWYGRAGTYRIQKHGLEYRTLSSFWLVSPPLTSLMYGLTRDAFLLVYADKEEELFKIADNEEIRRIINEVDAKAARKIWNNQLKPFYESVVLKSEKPEFGTVFIDNSPYKNPEARNVIDTMIMKSYKHYFDPLKTADYWRVRLDPKVESFNSSYGIYHFATAIQIKGLEEAMVELTKLKIKEG